MVPGAHSYCQKLPPYPLRDPDSNSFVGRLSVQAGPPAGKHTGALEVDRHGEQLDAMHLVCCSSRMPLARALRERDKWNVADGFVVMAAVSEGSWRRKTRACISWTTYVTASLFAALFTTDMINAVLQQIVGPG